MNFFTEVRILAANHGRGVGQASGALQATRKQNSQGQQSISSLRGVKLVGSGHQLLLCFEERGPAGAAARYPLLREACARAGGSTKECTGVVRGGAAHRKVRISGHNSHGVANGTIMPKKKMCSTRKTRLCTTEVLEHPPK